MTASVIASAKNGAIVAGATGVVVTHGFSLVNGDVLLAVVGAAEADQTAFACSGWTVVPSSYSEAAGGADRASALLYKVITNAGGEPSSYTFTRTGDATTIAQGVLILQTRGISTVTPLDASVVVADIQNDMTPDAPDITTATSGALIITTQVCVNEGGSSDPFSDVTPTAPATMTLVDSRIVSDASTDNDLFVTMAYVVAGTAGAYTFGSWQHTGGEAFNDSVVTTIALAPTAATLDITVDAVVQSDEWTGTTPDTHILTPTQEIHGVLALFVSSGSVVDDAITGCSASGRAMTRVPNSFAVDNAGEAGTACAYFVGSGIPAGALTITPTQGAFSATRRFFAYAITGPGDLEVHANAIAEGDVANPGVTLDSGVLEGLIVMAMFSGRPTANVDAGTGMAVDFETPVAADARSFHAAHESATGVTGSRSLAWAVPGADDTALTAALITQAFSVGTQPASMRSLSSLESMKAR